MKLPERKIYIYLFLFSIISISCSNPLIDKATEEHKQYMESPNAWREKVDDDIHRYNITRDTNILYNTLAYLNDIPQNNENKKACLNRRLVVLRLLHKYDMALAELDTCPDDIGNFGKKEQLLVTEISQYNYCHQYEERDQKFDELIAYMEYCFERQKSVTEGDKLKYLTKYENNPLALDAIPIEVDFHALNIYLFTRRMRGDKTKELEPIIENYYQKGVIGELDRDWLLELVKAEYKEKDFDLNL